MHSDYNVVFGIGQEYSGETLSAVNRFSQEMWALGKTSGQSMKLINIVLKNKFSNRGAVSKKGVAADDKAVLDICKLTPLLNYPESGAYTIVDEVAYFRYNALGWENNIEFSNGAYKKYSLSLFLEYMLSMCICYCEVASGARVDKFFATRNPTLAQMVCEPNTLNLQQLMQYLAVSPSDVQKAQLPVLKLTTSGNFMKVIKPRAPFKLTEDVKITPVFFMNIWLETLIPRLKSGVVRFVYVKDNKQEREMFSTLNEEIMMRFYSRNGVPDVDLVRHRLAASDTSKLARGYIRIPEFGISRYDETGVRALNLARIVDFEMVDENSVSRDFLDVDLSIVKGEFERYLGAVMRDEVLLRNLYELITSNQAPEGIQPSIIHKGIMDWLNMNISIGTTTFQRQLHTFMISNPMFFGGYTGRPRSYSGVAPQNSGGFNMGVAGTMDF